MPKVSTLRASELSTESYPPKAGGMSVGISHGVRITHLPTGNSVICNSERSQHLNHRKALEALEYTLI